MKKRIAALLVMLALCLTASVQAEVELLAASVGKGDALLLRVDDYVCLIDTGKDDRRSAVEAALREMGVEALDAVFITHGDKDHTGGLKWLRKGDMPIGAIYASAFHPDWSAEKHAAQKAADKLGLTVNWLQAGDTVKLGETDAMFYVYAPATEIAGNEDDNSLVMLMDAPDGRILFTGDMEFVEEQALLNSGADLACDVLKVPNHGDSDAAGAGLIAACAPRVAVISTDGTEKPGTPDPTVTARLEAAGAEIFVTENAAVGVRVLLANGEIAAEYLN